MNNDSNNLGTFLVQEIKEILANQQTILIVCILLFIILVLCFLIMGAYFLDKHFAKKKELKLKEKYLKEEESKENKIETKIENLDNKNQNNEIGKTNQIKKKKVSKEK